MVPTISRSTRITHVSATKIDNIYESTNLIRINKLDDTLSGILSVDMSDHLPIFIYMASKIKRKSKQLIFKCRKLDGSVFQNIKTFLCVTDWSFRNNIGLKESYEKFINVIHEYTDIYAPLKAVHIPPKCIIREPWMTKAY